MEELKKFRNSMNLTINEMSQAIGVSKSYYEKIEMGFRKPSRNFIENLKKRFPQFDANIFFNISQH